MLLLTNKKNSLNIFLRGIEKKGTSSQAFWMEWKETCVFMLYIHEQHPQ